MAGAGEGKLLTIEPFERRHTAHIKRGNKWLKPTGNLSRVQCWCGSANPTLDPYLQDPHDKTHGFAQTRELPYIALK